MDWKFGIMTYDRNSPEESVIKSKNFPVFKVNNTDLDTVIRCSMKAPELLLESCKNIEQSADTSYNGYSDNKNWVAVNGSYPLIEEFLVIGGFLRISHLKKLYYLVLIKE